VDVKIGSSIPYIKEDKVMHSHHRQMLSIALLSTLALTATSRAATIGTFTFPTATALPAGGIVNIQAYSVQTAIGLGSKVSFNQNFYDPASGKSPTIANGGALATSLTAAFPAASFNLATGTTTPKLPAPPAGSSIVGVISANAFLGPYDIAEVAAGSNAAAAKAGFNVTLGGNVTKTAIKANLIVMKIDSPNDADMDNPGQLVVDINGGPPIIAALNGGDTPDEEAALLAKALDGAGFVATDVAGTDEVDIDWNNPTNSALLGTDANIQFGMQNSGGGYELELDFPQTSTAPEPGTNAFLAGGLTLMAISWLVRRKMQAGQVGNLPH
jgi:hypothetical protein